jgi:hypothetical protein
VPNHPALVGDARQTEKNPQNKILKETLQIWTPLSIGAGCIVASILAQRSAE